MSVKRDLLHILQKASLETQEVLTKLNPIPCNLYCLS